MQRTSILFAFFLGLCAFCLPSCSLKAPQNGLHLTLEVDWEAYLNSLAKNRDDARFEEALREAIRTRDDSHKSFAERFVRTAETKDLNHLASYFSEADNGLNFQSSNDELIIWLDKQLHQGLHKNAEVIRRRLENFGVAEPMIEVGEKSGRIYLELPPDLDSRRITGLVRGSGKLGFWKTETYAAAYQILLRINQNALQLQPIDSTRLPVADMWGLTPEQEMQKFRVENPFLGQMNLTHMIDPDGPFCGLAAIEDTAKINVFIRDAEEKGLTENRKFLWTAQPNPDYEAVGLELVCLIPNRSGGPDLDGDCIVKARMDFEVGTDRPMITINMDEEGARKWMRLTKGMVGRSIAMVYDGHVLSAPRVMGTIEGGRSQITGNFTVEEARDLANFIEAGSMALPMRVMSSTVFSESGLAMSDLGEMVHLSGVSVQLQMGPAVRAADGTLYLLEGVGAWKREQEGRRVRVGGQSVGSREVTAEKVDREGEAWTRGSTEKGQVMVLQEAEVWEVRGE